MRRWYVGLGAFALVVASVGTLRLLRARGAVSAASTELVDAPAAVLVQAPAAPLVPSFSGLDLVHVALADDGATAPLDAKRTAKLSLDPLLQKTAQGILAQHHLPEAAVVMIDPATGEVLVYANHVENGPKRDIIASARAPSASVFKLITASALVDHAGLGAATRECYAGGGEQRLTSADLVVDPLRDKYCVSLATALGKSTNAVFARLAQRRLKPAELNDEARAYGYGAPVPFEVPIAVSDVKIPSDALPFARTAAGFWNSTLTPLQAAWISATVAHGGEALKPTIVREILGPDGASVWTAPKGPTVVRRAVPKDTAAAVTTMMEHTISEGTSFRAFHDPRGASFLPAGLVAAGKTGTLNDPDGQHYYTWFTGFAPSHPKPGEKQVAIAVLVVNGPHWHVKANVVAREMLRAYFQGPGKPAAVATK